MNAQALRQRFDEIYAEGQHEPERVNELVAYEFDITLDEYFDLLDKETV